MERAKKGVKKVIVLRFQIREVVPVLRRAIQQYSRPKTGRNPVGFPDVLTPKAVREVFPV